MYMYHRFAPRLLYVVQTTSGNGFHNSGSITANKIIFFSADNVYFSEQFDYRYSLWNAKLTETRIFRELSIEIEKLQSSISSIEIESSLIELKSSLIELKSSLIQLESSLIQLESSLIQLLSSLYMYNKRVH